MKTKFYLMTFFVFFGLAVLAQKYNVLLIEQWTNNVWSNSYRTTNSYDSNGNILKITSEVWNEGTNSWDNLSISSNTLNSDGTIKETLTQTWVAASSAFNDVSKDIFTYSASKKILTKTSQIMFAVIWTDFSKTVYTYNGNDLLTTEVNQMSNFLTPVLVNSSQIIYTYNSDGTLNQTVDQIWNASNQWVNSTRTTNTYNASKQLTLSLDEKWVTDAWSNDSRSTSTYNAAGSLSGVVNESWTNNAWVNAYTSMFSYNTTNVLSQIITQDWNTALSQWENKVRLTYNYNATGIDPVKLAGTGTIVFPNPFEDQLTIQSSSLDEHIIKVFNVSGQLMNEFKTNQSATNLKLSWLKKGVYFMKIKSLQNEQTIKLVKAR